MIENCDNILINHLIKIIILSITIYTIYCMNCMVIAINKLFKRKVITQETALKIIHILSEYKNIKNMIDGSPYINLTEKEFDRYLDKNGLIYYDDFE